MSRIRGVIDLQQVPKESYDPDLALRAAVVREGRILGSTTLETAAAKERQLAFEVVFEAPILPGSPFPCGVILVVGPNIDDQQLLGVETLTLPVELAAREGRADESAASATATDVGLLAVDPQLYLCWLRCCRTYTIRGRVVCRRWAYDPIEQQWVWCDEPVPGATVEAFDVDCWWLWCRRDLIETAVTAIDGSFEITFKWCCTRLYPWLHGDWAVDPDLLRDIRELLAAADIPFPPQPPGPRPDPTFFQELLGGTEGLPGEVLGAASSLPETMRLISTPGPGASVSAEALQALLPPSPELEALHVWPWFWRPDCAPDVVFRVTQPCDDEIAVVYSESLAQTRWDIGTELAVTLLANDKACCIPSCRDPECPECAKLTWIHCTPTEKIGTDSGPPDLRGYAYTSNADGRKDRPFYDSMRVRGEIASDVDYFKVQFSYNGGGWNDLPTPAFAGFTRKYWNGAAMVAAPAPGFQPTAKSGETVMVTRRHFEQLHGLPKFPPVTGSVIWNDFDTLFYFNAKDPSVTPDGLYQLRLVGYAANAADDLDLPSERILPTCGQQSDESVYVRVDNQAQNHPPSTPDHPCGSPIVHKCTDEPDCYIREVCKNEGQPDEVCISACDIVRLDADDTLTIHFSVTVPQTVEDGHLGGYWLRAEYGLSAQFYTGTGAHGVFTEDPPAAAVQLGPRYSQALAQGAPRPYWYGGDYKVTLTGADFPECCAYQLRLWAWKRTTRGCTNPSLVHWNQFTLSFTVLRPELCPDTCPEPEAE